MGTASNCFVTDETRDNFATSNDVDSCAHDQDDCRDRLPAPLENR